jgi:HEPN domain-containing protein/predicted nucleotidyltransferase
MAKRKSNLEPLTWYEGANIPMRVIRALARRVAERFHPDKIILFGSYAYGTPHEDSDVDILVVMPARNQLDQAVQIDRVCQPCFPLDIIVRTPKNMQWRLKEGDSFLREIVSQGKILYEKTHRRVGAKSGRGLRAAVLLERGREPLHDQSCFHCQQAAEKFLKALLAELGLSIPRTHVLRQVLMHLLPHHPSLRSLQRVNFLTQFAVTTRYPGDRATKRQAQAALRWAGKVRDEVRHLLGLRPSRKRRKK